MHLLPLGVFVIAAIIVFIAAYFYSAYVADQVQKLEMQRAQQRQQALYACLNARLEGNDVVFPSKVHISYYYRGSWYYYVGDRAPIDAQPIYVGDVCYVYMDASGLKAMIYG